MDKKLYPCKKCGTKVPIRSKGLCGICRQNQRKEEGTLPQYKKKIKPFKASNKAKRKEERGCLGVYFEYHLEELNRMPSSIESKKPIYSPTVANIAHLLPKRKTGGFPSVQCNIENAIYLTIQEHNHFDKLLDEGNFERLEKDFKNSWDYICLKYKKLLDLCIERNKLYFKLKEYLDGKLD